MNILHISSATSWRGGEQQITYLIEELSKLGHNNYLMHPNDAPISKHKSIIENCKLLPYSKRFSLNPIVAKSIKKNASQNNIDIIHAHDSHAHTFLYMSYRIFRLKHLSVVSRRVDFPISSSSFKKYTHPKIKKIICVSDKINEIISSSINTSKTVATVHSGVDLEKFKENSSINLRQHYEIPSTHKLIANVSAIADHKDYETFVLTAQKLLKSRSDLSFLIIGGDGGEKDKIEKLITSQNLEKNIILTGYIEDAYKLIKQLDVFFFPSKMEGLGTSILDAQASNIPVVSTIAGGIPELIQHDHSGLLSPVGDINDLAKNISNLLDNETLQNRLKENARVNVIQFSKKHTAQKTLDVYNSVI